MRCKVFLYSGLPIHYLSVGAIILRVSSAPMHTSP
jgi:hypothetical protein